MSGTKHNEIGPGHLAVFLAELLQQFRHFSTPMEPVPGVASRLARIKISARLLAALGPAPGPVGEEFTRLGGVLGEWVAGFESSPESFPSTLASPFGHLADYLEELLARHDQGVPAAALAADPGWGVALALFHHAGTPLDVLEEVDGLFGKWGGRWTEENLTPAREQQLRRRWLSLRKRGDALFLKEEDAAPWTAPEGASADGGPAVLLLVDSSFRREEIRDKLTDRDFKVEIPCDPDQALEFLAVGPPPRAVLCDNLEPTRHLACLRRGLSGPGRAGNVPLILLTGNPGRGADTLAMARAQGAAAVWAEPFDPRDLNRILQRLGGP